MSIESFFTLQSIPAPQGQTAAKTGGSLTSAQLQGLNFIDLILARLNENAEGEQSGENAENVESAESALQSDNPLLDKDPKLNLAELLAANPGIEEEIRDLIAATQLGPDAELTQTLALNQQAFDDALKPLTDGIITAEELAKGSPRILQALLIEGDQNNNALLSKINQIKVKLESISENGEGAVITTNLTPEQITALQNLPEGADIPAEFLDRISIVLISLNAPEDHPAAITTETEVINDGLGDDPVVQNVLAILLQPAAKTQHKAGSELQATLPGQPAEQGKAPIDILAGRLNSLSPGGNQEALFEIKEFEGSQQPQQNGLKNGKASENANFELALKQAGKGMTSPDLSTLFAHGSGALSLPGFPPELLEQYGMSNTANAALTTSALTSLVTQSHSAATPHPATQMVAINIQKMANNGEGKTLALQLDPPELGRVEIRMSFGKDKSIKAVLTAEKPETYLMLQRDAQSLERALQEAGLDSDGGLSFELAEHGFDFDHNNQRGGGHDNGGTGAGDDAESEEIIESTMTWHVDPDSGHMRYDILA